MLSDSKYVYQLHQIWQPNHIKGCCSSATSSRGECPALGWLALYWPCAGWVGAIICALHNSTAAESFMHASGNASMPLRDSHTAGMHRVWALRAFESQPGTWLS